MDCIRDYWEEIQSGHIIVPRRIIQQYRPLVEELDHPKGPWVFDESKANAPISFIERFCKQSKGRWIGREIELQLFQKAKFQAIFGFVHADTGLRRCREVFSVEARKNGKSCETSGIGNYMLLADGEGGPQVCCVATKRDQARIVFGEAVNMVRQSPALQRFIRKRKSDMYSPFNFGTFEPLSSDSNTLDGLNMSCGILDEVHAMKDRNIYDVSVQSMGTREQPLMYIITTSGFVRGGIYDELYDLSCKRLNGLEGFEDQTKLAFIYELDDRSEWTDPRMWEKANPGLGTIKSYDYLAKQVEDAKRRPNYLPTVLTKDFNVRETAAGAWMTYQDIENKATFRMEDVTDTYAIGGCDLSATTDLTCATLLIMKAGSDAKYILQQYFLPQELLDKRVHEDKIPYDIWSKRGLLTACPGWKVNYSDVTAWFNKMRDEFKILPVWVYYDRALAGYWSEEMTSNGYTMVKCAQGAMTFSHPMKLLEADLKAKLVNYNANPVLIWCLCNTSAKRDDNDNIRPIKGVSSRNRIDGMVSLLDAYVGLYEHQQDYNALI